jgi:glycosyltransferase involved in cell wall biosynthesis
MSPRFGVVIPAHNEEFELPHTLNAFSIAIEQSQGNAADFEFIVVDNASTDRTSHIAEAWGAKVVYESVRQIARVRNSGARAATGEILITCDADSRPHPQIFNAIEYWMSHKIFAGGVRIWARPMKLSYLPAFLLLNLVCVLFRLPAGMFFLRREDFVALGGFNESLYALEDVEFARRLRLAARDRGMKIKILWSHPILTSTRKFRLCRLWHILKLVFLSLWDPKKYLSRREYWNQLYYAENLRETSSKTTP